MRVPDGSPGTLSSRAGLAAVRAAGPPPEGSARPRLVHLHRYRRSGDDRFSNVSLYVCRCGVVRSGL